jgi:tetratricopeptide (TPR) repeat protein
MSTTLNQAIEHHKVGAFVDAVHLYREILIAEPEHADALHLLGVLMHQMNHSQLAVELIDRAIQVNRRFGPYHNNLGNALLATGRVEEARHSFRRSLALSPSAETYINLGNLELSQREWGAAKRSFHAALRSSPKSFEAHFGLGNLAIAQDKHALAAQWYERALALALAPESSQALNALGNARFGQGDMEEAIASYQRAIELAPSNHEAYINLGNAYMRQDRFESAVPVYEQGVRCLPSDRDPVVLLGIAYLKTRASEKAIQVFSKAVELDPNYAVSHQLLGHALVQSRYFQQTIPCFERALFLDPRNHEAHNGLGTALEGLGEFANADVAFRAALALQPESVEYLVNVGLNMARQRDPSGIELLERAIQIDPNHFEAHYALAEVLLATGFYERGFQEYEWRWNSPDLSKSVRYFSQPMWDGQPLNGRAILLHAEQGFGDTIQFVRFIKDVVRLGGVVLLEVQPGLYRLLAQLEGVQSCLRQGIDMLPSFDVHCPLMSLPYLLGTTIDSVPSPVSLTAVRNDSSNVDQAPSLRVGVVWAGNPEHKRDSFRSVPLSSLSPLWEVVGVTMVSLQKNVPRSDLPMLLGLAMECALEGCQDFLDTAAVIRGLDLIIAVDTAVAHLAASTGKHVWLILPQAADWRWGMWGDTTPWYPTMRLFRHETTREELVARLAAELKRSSGEYILPSDTEL